MPKAQPSPAKPKGKYASYSNLYIPPVLSEALKKLAADNKFRGRKGENYSALMALLGKRYATQPDKLVVLREIGFKQVEELLAL